MFSFGCQVEAPLRFPHIQFCCLKAGLMSRFGGLELSRKLPPFDHRLLKEGLPLREKLSFGALCLYQIFFRLSQDSSSWGGFHGFPTLPWVSGPTTDDRPPLPPHLRTIDPCRKAHFLRSAKRQSTKMVTDYQCFTTQWCTQKIAKLVFN